MEEESSSRRTRTFPPLPRATKEQKTRLNTPVIVVIHATGWLLLSSSSSRPTLRAIRNLARTTTFPFYYAPLRSRKSLAERKKLGQFAPSRKRKPREKKKKKKFGFSSGTKGTRERFRCSEYANGLSWPFRGARDWVDSLEAIHVSILLSRRVYPPRSSGVPGIAMATNRSQVRSIKDRPRVYLRALMRRFDGLIMTVREKNGGGP